MDDKNTKPADASTPAETPAAEKPAKTKRTPTAVPLSDGRTALLRPAFGLDLEKAASMARGRGSNSMALLLAVASLVMTIDGGGIAYEDVLQFPIEDCFELIGAVMGNGTVPSQL